MPAPTEHFRLEEVAPGIHAAIATPGGFGLCNGTIVDLGGATLVFDAMLTPDAGTALGHAARRLTGRPIDLLVDSHHHGDHVRGNAAVAAQHVVSTPKTRELIVARASEYLESDRKEAVVELDGLRSGKIPAAPAEREILEAWFEGILATPVGMAVRPPDLTFTDELAVRGTRREARILTYGGGHSPSDVFVHLPDERLLLLGDLVAIGFHPSLGDGRPNAWRRILGRIEALGAERVVPGHGPVGPAGSIRAISDYLATVVRYAQALPPGSGEAVAVPPAPPSCDGWKFARFFESNVRYAAELLRADPTA